MIKSSCLHHGQQLSRPCLVMVYTIGSYVSNGRMTLCCCGRLYPDLFYNRSWAIPHLLDYTLFILQLCNLLLNHLIMIALLLPSPRLAPSFPHGMHALSSVGDTAHIKSILLWLKGALSATPIMLPCNAVSIWLPHMCPSLLSQQRQSTTASCALAYYNPCCPLPSVYDSYSSTSRISYVMAFATALRFLIPVSFPLFCHNHS